MQRNYFTLHRKLCKIKEKDSSFVLRLKANEQINYTIR